MIDEILDTRSLGDRGQIEYILELTGSGTHTESSLMEACYARSYGFRDSFRALLKLLAVINYLAIEDGRVRVGQIPSLEHPERFVPVFCERLFAALACEGILHHLFNNETIYVDPHNRLIHFRNSRVPLRYAAIRNLLLNLGLMVRHPMLHNVFVVADHYYEWLSVTLVELIADSETARGMTLDQLRSRQKRQEDAGRRAEEYVVAFEKRRVADHPSVDNIRMISDLDVGAGYDILSFIGVDSVVFDRYIEVKSFSGAPTFYWSANEVKVAKEKGGSYYLCLVDLEEIDVPTYRPIFIQNPATSMCSDADWMCSCATWFFEKR